MDSLRDQRILNDNISTFYECSRDDAHGTFMNVPKLPCVNFDQVVSEFTKKMGFEKKCAASADSFAFCANGDNAVVLVEFKNGKIKNGNTKSNIREKMCNSLLIVEAILNRPWTELRNTIEFILVYNEKENPKDQVKDTIKDKLYNRASGTQNVRFNLARHYGMYYRKIRTLTENEFSEIVIKERLTFLDHM